MKTKYILIIFAGALLTSSFSCKKDNKQPKETSEKNLYQTWVLTEKEINSVTETLPTDDTYPITLTFYSTKNFRGRHDANTYEGTYKMNLNTISISYNGITDVTDIKWYWNYILELSKINKIWFIDSNNMQLSNQNDSIILHFINKNSFEKIYYKLEDRYLKLLKNNML